MLHILLTFPSTTFLDYEYLLWWTWPHIQVILEFFSFQGKGTHTLVYATYSAPFKSPLGVVPSFHCSSSARVNLLSPFVTSWWDGTWDRSLIIPSTPRRPFYYFFLKTQTHFICGGLGGMLGSRPFTGVIFSSPWIFSLEGTCTFTLTLEGTPRHVCPRLGHEWW